jgi:hypothetical protein
MALLQCLLGDLGPNATVWHDEVQPDGSIKRTQVSCPARLDLNDKWLMASYLLTWGYVIERLIQLINARRKIFGVRLLSLAQAWGDLPMGMWERYLELKKVHLNFSMPDTIEALQITHPMTPFFPARMLDLKDSTRERSRRTLERTCKLLDITPMDVYLPHTGKMKVLSALRKMILQTRRKRFWASAEGRAVITRLQEGVSLVTCSS